MVHWNPIAAMHAVNSLLALAALFLAWRRRQLPGGLQVCALLAAIFLWIFFAFLEAWVVAPEQKQLMAAFRYLGVTLTPLAYFRLSQEFGEERMPRLKATMIVLAFLELSVCLLAFTNSHHHLLWSGFRPIAYGQVVNLHGPAYVGVLVLHYSLFLVASLRMVRAVFHFPRHYWKMALLLLLSIAVPFVSSLVYVLGLAPLSIDPTPMGLSFTGMALGWGLLRTRLLDIAPIARELLVERMREGILVFDRQGRLVDYNPAAQAILGTMAGIGSLSSGLVPPWNRLAEALMPSQDARLEISPFQGVWYEVRISSLQAVASRSIGHMVSLHDISARKELEERLERMATRDMLTGLPNRRQVAQILVREAARCLREGVELAVLMLDVDHFKKINDTLGHAAGDRVLTELGGLLTGTVRGHDCAGRWGGEEFVVVLSGCSREHALGRAETWRERIASERIPWEGGEIRCTVSIGVAVLPGDGCEMDGLLSAADAALYRSKREGRNRVTMAGSPER